MRKIVDVNYLRNPELRVYLESTDQNIAVVNDLACIETYRAGTLKNVTASYRILSDFPEQVVVLKATADVVALDSEAGLNPDCLIDATANRDFRSFYPSVVRANNGDAVAIAQIEKLGDVANARYEAMRLDAKTLAEGIEVNEGSFSKEDLSDLRNRTTMSSEATDRFVKQIFVVAASLRAKHSTGSATPALDIVRETFGFRIAIAVCLLSLRWVSLGGIRSAQEATVTNDVIDLAYSVYATFFDGLLTSDKKMLEIYNDTQWILEELFPPGTEGRSGGA